MIVVQVRSGRSQSFERRRHMGIRIRPAEVEIPHDDPFRCDLLDRKVPAEFLTQLVDSIDGPCVMAIDAPWGAGKTTFLKMWSRHLRNNGFPVVEFNAWETDHAADPFVALVSELKEGLSEFAEGSLKVQIETTANAALQVVLRAIPGLIRIATLDSAEVKMLEVALREIPESVVSARSVEEGRKIEREGRDRAESKRIESDGQHGEDDREGIGNDVLLSLKNMEILGQILRNKYGSLPVTKLEEIVSTIADAGLRLVGVVTDRTGIEAFEDYIAGMVAEAKADAKSAVLDDTRRRFRAIVIFLVHFLLSRIAVSVGKKELRGVVRGAVRRRGTVAYEMIGVFYALGAAESVSEALVNEIVRFLRRCDREHNRIAWRLVSLETQRYLNTHRVKPRLRQRLYAELKLTYHPNTR